MAPKMTDISTQPEPKEMCDQDQGQGQDQGQEAMEELYKMYDEMLQREAEETPQYIGYCGFPCDGYCSECGGRGTFDMADEI